MKLLSLNIWQGQVYEPLKNFIQSHSKEVDIFCFQEVEKEGERNLFDEIQTWLPDFVGHFAEQVSGVGAATFVRNTVKVEKTDSSLILSAEELNHLKMSSGLNYYPRILQAVSLKHPNIIIYNFHGVPGNGKIDTEERKLQTERLLDILDNSYTPKILVGDFNLNRDTEAISTLGKKMKNLIAESSFETTRSSHYDKKDAMPFADYAFVSSEIEVKNFQVLQDEVSDHLPLLLEFDY